MHSSMQSLMATNKFVFEQLVKIVKEIHNKIVNTESNTTVNHCLKQLYQLHKYAEVDSFEKKYYNSVVTDMCNYIQTQCNASKIDIYETWVKVVFDANDIPTSNDMTIYNNFKRFFFGDVQIYEIIFELNDKTTRQGRYYYVFKLFLKSNSEDVIDMHISIQDLKNNNINDSKKGLSMIKGSSISEDGYVKFSLSNETLFDLAKYSFQEFNNHGFQGGFELYPKLSLSTQFTQYKKIEMKNTFLQEYFDNYLMTNYINNKLQSMFSPF